METLKKSVSYDMIGVGFGPSNLSLAIALQDQSKNNRALDALFLDKQSNYLWHGNTITSQSELQVSFLKDLVSLRDPTSPYSFVNYLHTHGRFNDFINLGTFYPSRLEFNDYLGWVAKHFEHQSRYGEEVLSVEPIIKQNCVKTLCVRSCDSNGRELTRETKSLVVSAGGTPNIPEVFRPFSKDKRIFHHSHYLKAMSEQPDLEGKPLRIAVVGGGQSAAEAFLDLHDNYPSANIDLIVRSFSLKPADSSPFVNQIFSPFSTDLTFSQAQAKRDVLRTEHKHTNYSAVDMPMIEQIYGIFYRQKVTQIARHSFCGSSIIENVQASATAVELRVRDTSTGRAVDNQYDIVILATGYKRQKHRELLAPVAEYMGDYEVDRNYQIQTQKRFEAPIYLQGYCESSHGLSDTLLSVLAIRSGEIAEALYTSLGCANEPQRTHQAQPNMVESV